VESKATTPYRSKRQNCGGCGRSSHDMHYVSVYLERLRKPRNTKRRRASGPSIDVGISQIRSRSTTVHIHSSVALQPFFGLCPHFQFRNLHTQSVGIIGRGISPSQGLYLHIGQHKHRINTYNHPGLEWDSNPRPQRSSGRRQFMPQAARPL
jgi:hypothetical protein